MGIELLQLNHMFTGEEFIVNSERYFLVLSVFVRRVIARRYFWPSWMLFFFCFASIITSLLGISTLGSCQVWPWMFADSCLTYKCTSLYSGTLWLSIVVSDKSQKFTIYMRLTRFFHVPGFEVLDFFEFLVGNPCCRYDMDCLWSFSSLQLCSINLGKAGVDLISWWLFTVQNVHTGYWVVVNYFTDVTWGNKIVDIVL